MKARSDIQKRDQLNNSGIINKTVPPCYDIPLSISFYYGPPFFTAQGVVCEIEYWGIFIEFIS